MKWTGVYHCQHYSDRICTECEAAETETMKPLDRSDLISALTGLIDGIEFGFAQDSVSASDRLVDAALDRAKEVLEYEAKCAEERRSLPPQGDLGERTAREVAHGLDRGHGMTIGDCCGAQLDDGESDHYDECNIATAAILADRLSRPPLDLGALLSEAEEWALKQISEMRERWDDALEWHEAPPHAEPFDDGKINVTTAELHAASIVAKLVARLRAATAGGGR